MSDESFEKYNIEDGHLSFNIKPSDKILKQIEKEKLQHICQNPILNHV